MQMSTLINCYVLPAIILYSTLGLSWGIDTTLVPLDDRWGGTDCWVGMYKHGDYEGPSDDKGLEAQPATDGSCIPLDDGHKNAIKSYKVGGDCVCSFYDDSECQIKLFDANRRWDGSLRNNGGNDNKIESYSCQRAPGLSCRLSLWYGCSAADLVKNGYNCGSIWERAPLEGKSSEKGEDSGCIDVPPEDNVPTDRITAVGVSNNSCGCIMYDAPGCPADRVMMDYRAPNMAGFALGKREMTVKSFKCYFNTALYPPAPQ